MRLTESELQSALSELGASSVADDKHPASYAYLSLSLPSRGLTDISLLSSFPYLTSLDLSHNALSSLQPISCLPHLSHLSLADCELSSFSLSSPLSSLLSLSLSHNALSALSCLALTPFLTALDISHNSFSSLSLSSLSHLQRLQASHNELLQLTADSLPSASLSVLSLAHNRVSSLHSFPPLPSLLELDVSHCFLQSLQSVSALTAAADGSAPSASPLHTLQAQDNYISSMSALSYLPKLPFLSTLSLQGCPLAASPSYPSCVLFLLPSLLRLDSPSPVPVRHVLEAWEHNGEDEARRTRVRRWLLPFGDETVPADVDETARSLQAGKEGRQQLQRVSDLRQQQQQPEGSELDRRSVSAFLPAPRYWQLMTERGFVRCWIPLYAQLQEAAAATPHLDLSGIALGEAGLRALAYFLASSPSSAGLQSLNLRQTMSAQRPSSRLCSPSSLSCVLAAIPHTAVHSLSLARCELQAAHIQLLASASLPLLRNLDLSHNSGIGAHSPLAPCPSLTLLLQAVAAGGVLRLNLADCGLDARGGEELGDWLGAEGAALQDLVLDCNGLGDAGVSAVAAGLRRNDSLRSLSLRRLSSPAVTSAALSALCVALAKYNDALLSLDASDNAMLAAEPSIAASLAAVLSRDSRYRSTRCSLQELRLSGCGVGGEVLTEVGRALQGNGSLRVLELGCGDGSRAVTAEAAEVFCAGVGSSSLQSLHLSGFVLPLSNGGTVSAFAQLLLSPALKQVRFPCIRCSQPASAAEVASMQEAWAAGAMRWEEVELQSSGEVMSEEEGGMLQAVLAAPSPSLLSITLRSFRISDVFTQRLSAALSSHPALSSVSLLDCRLSAEALSVLVAGLSSRVLQLDLSGTPVASLSCALPAGLQSLRLARCGLSSLSASSLQHTRGLSSLDLSRNSLPAAAVLVLSSVLPQLPALSFLTLAHNVLPDSPQALHAITSLLRGSSGCCGGLQLSLPSVSSSAPHADSRDASTITSRLLHALSDDSSAGGSSGSGLRRLTLGRGMEVRVEHQKQIIAAITAAEEAGARTALECVEVIEEEDEDELQANSQQQQQQQAEERGELEGDCVLNTLAALYAMNRLKNSAQ